MPAELWHGGLRQLRRPRAHVRRFLGHDDAAAGVQAVVIRADFCEGGPLLFGAPRRQQQPAARRRTSRARARKGFASRKFSRPGSTTPQTKSHTVAICTPSRNASSHCKSRANEWRALACEVSIALKSVLAHSLFSRPVVLVDAWLELIRQIEATSSRTKLNENSSGIIRAASFLITRITPDLHHVRHILI